MTGGEAVHQALRALGVEHVFGIVSIHNLPIYDAIARGGGIRCIDVRHEQAGVHMADGYARATGRLGVAIASTGPGTTNAVTGLYEAAYASSPVLLITGQTETLYYGKGKGYIHEAESQLAMLRTVTRRAESVRSADQIAETIVRVAADVQTGRPQPGAVEIPIDLQSQPARVGVPPVPEFWPRAEPDPAAIEAAAERLARAERRVILAGGGVIGADAARELTALAEALGAPVLTSGNGRGAIPEDHPLCMGPLLQNPELREVLREAEVLLAVGTRFQGGSGGRAWLPLPCPLLHLDADPRMIGLNHPAAVAIVADARLGLAALLKRLDGAPGDAGFATRMADARDEARQQIRTQMGPDHEVVMNVMRETLPRDSVIVRDSTVPAYVWGNRLLPILEPRTSITPTSTAIGPGFPLGLGAALGSGKKTLVLHGDGGFMLHTGELATAAQYDLPVVVCIFNDGGYGVLRRLQAMQFEGRTTGVDLATPDFAALARAMGVTGESVKGTDEFRAAFARAVDASGPVLLDIDMAALAPMQPFGAPPTSRR